MNDGIDSFLHGLRSLSAGLGTTSSSSEPTMVIVVERVERLYENPPELVVPLTRLAKWVSRIFLCICMWDLSC